MTDFVYIDYTNYRRERAWRRVIPLGIKFDSNEWHPEVQWLLTAFEVDKNTWRTFAMKDIHAWQSSAPSEAPVVRGALTAALGLIGEG